MSANDFELELNAAVDKVLASKSRKKLVIAGPVRAKPRCFVDFSNRLKELRITVWS
jgi:hypothetical protein